MREVTGRAFEFGAESGVSMHKVALKWKSNAHGRPFLYFCASEDISKDEVLLNIPDEIVLSPRKAMRVPALAELIRRHPELFSSGDRFTNQCFLLIVLVLFELNKGKESGFSSFFELVFRTNDLDFLTRENAEFVRDPFTRQFMSAEVSKFEKMFRLIEPVLRTHADLLGECEQSRFNRIALLVFSRYFVNEFNQLLLVPFFDLMNHSNEGTVKFRQMDQVEAKQLRKLSLELNNSEENYEICEDPEPWISPEHPATPAISPLQKFYDDDSASVDSGYGSNFTDEDFQNELDEFENPCNVSKCTLDSEPEPPVRGSEEEEAGIKLVSTSRQPIRKNQEITISYGRRSNFFLLTFYGFCLPKNKFNHFRFYFDAARFRKDVTSNNKSNYQIWTAYSPTERSSVFKFKAGQLSLDFLSKLRECFGLQGRLTIASEKVVVAAYFGFFDHFVSEFERPHRQPQNEFQKFAEISDCQLEDIVREQKKMAARLLGVLKNIEQNPRFNVGCIQSYMCNSMLPSEKKEIMKGMLSLRNYFSLVIDPIISDRA